MVLSEYSPEVLRFGARRFINLVVTALKRRNERDLFFRWVLEGFSTRMSFDDYKKNFRPVEKKSAKEILEQTKTILEGATWQHHSLN